MNGITFHDSFDRGEYFELFLTAKNGDFVVCIYKTEDKMTCRQAKESIGNIFTLEHVDDFFWEHLKKQHNFTHPLYVPKPKPGDIYVSEHDGTLWVLQGIRPVSYHKQYSFTNFNTGAAWDVDDTDPKFSQLMPQAEYTKKYGATPKKDVCSHPNKYINRATRQPFWACPDCKADLGDAE